MYWNSFRQSIDRVVVEGQAVRNEYKVCDKGACTGILIGMSAAVDRLAAIGYANSAAIELAAKLPAASPGSEASPCNFTGPDAEKYGQITANDMIEVRIADGRAVMAKHGMYNTGNYSVKWSDGTVDEFSIAGMGSAPIYKRTSAQGNGIAGSACKKPQ
ncbi:hypothetical protein I7X39_01385 [Inhella sp. 1Y17]|uniref:Uncharacterized protein n=1 Tax=Inhella proteolytica TaxID=2795029 RepID=A0A931IZE7_9BURK|nr:hypothetical protein [Inhella proteolytica]